MVRCSHNDAHFVCKNAVLLVIVEECTSPHRRPHEIAFQTKDEFEDMLVALTVDSAEFLVSPVTERRPLIVNENSAILNLWLTIGIDTFLNEHIIAMLRRNIHEPIPRRNAHLVRQLVDSIDCASLVASGNDKSLAYARHRFVYNLKKILLALSL